MTHTFSRSVSGAVRFLVAAFAVGLPWLSDAKAEQPIPLSTAQRYFSEAESLCKADHGRLWGVSLCGPIMLVDNNSRFAVANQADVNGVLRQEEGVFTGTLPVDQNVANTAITWSGVRWTQMRWPLPDEANSRHTLVAHELFHRIQDQLHMPALKEGNNQHLDTLNGRYYMQLEWKALARAIEASADADRKKAVTDALVFRAERYKLFPEAAAQETALEMNEGLAEYTGVKLANTEPSGQAKAALGDLSKLQSNDTFVRSFAYATGPAYGLLLDHYVPNWRHKIRSGDGFMPLLQTSLHIAFGVNLEQIAAERAAEYGGPTIRAAEIERETRREQVLAKYRKQFIEGPVLTLALHHMQVQFDPRGLRPLGDTGTVYPTMRITDDWGVLEASQGALMKPDWSAVVVVAPSNADGASIKGDGWTLQLKPGWKLTPATRKGDFTLSSGS